MSAGIRSVEWRGRGEADLLAELGALYEPALLPGFVGAWPAVRGASGGAEEARAYLARFDSGVPLKAFVGPPEIDGRFFYARELAGMNFGVADTRLDHLVGKIVEEIGREDALAIYLGSSPVRQTLPGWEKENPLPLLAAKPTEPRIWIGTKSRIAAHYDESYNVACVVRGRRTFTLFPPGQVANLYVGPIDQTVAGQPTSMVDLARPDLAAHPRFAEALEHARTAALGPGDAIYIPALWWHAVEAPEPFNILVNYWWTDRPPDAGSPQHALGHALLSVSHLPEPERDAWRTLFDHYVFRKNGDPAAHIPPARRGILGPSTPQLRQTIRQFLLRALGGRQGG